MTPEALNEILQEVAAGRLAARQARARLVAAGLDPVDAEQLVFTALGGGDVVETGPDQVDRYKHSGRPVADVAADMER